MDDREAKLKKLYQDSTDLGDHEMAAKALNAIKEMRAAQPAATPEQKPEESSYLSQVGQNLKSEAKGLGAGVAGVAGLPMDTVLNITDLAKAGYGYTQSKITGKAPSDWTQPFDRSKIPLTSESLTPDALKMTQEDNPYLYAGGAGISGALLTRKIPGVNLSLGKAALYGQAGGMGSQGGRDIGQAIGGDTGGNIGAVVGGLAVPTAMSGAAKAMRISGKNVNPINDATLKEAQDAGYKVSPSQANAGFIPRTLEGGLAGKAKTEQELVVQNQKTTNDLARKSIGLNNEAPLDGESIKTVINTAYKDGYEPIKKLGAIKTDDAFKRDLTAISDEYHNSPSFPGAEKDSIGMALKPYLAAADAGSFNADDALRAIKTLRSDAKAEFKSGDPQVGTVKIAISKAIEDAIESDLIAKGESGAEALANYKNARKLIDKASTIDNALVEGGGNIDASKIARIYQNSPKLMDGELATIGKFANNFKQVSRLPKGGDSTPFSVLDAGLTGSALAAHSLAPVTGGASLLLAAAPLARLAAKKGITSDYMQNAMRRTADPSSTISDIAKAQLINPAVSNPKKGKK